MAACNQRSPRLSLLGAQSLDRDAGLYVQANKPWVKPSDTASWRFRCEVPEMTRLWWSSFDEAVSLLSPADATYIVGLVDETQRV